MTDWDDAFDNVGHVKNALAYFDTWAARSQSYQDSGVTHDLDLPYGPLPRERLDVFWPDTAPKGVVIFIHGGYWMRLDRLYFSDLAHGPLKHNWAVAIPSYTLAPAARINEITIQISEAIKYVAHKFDGPIRIIGHSAGGHLATRMLCENSPLPATIQNRIENTVSISGVHDLRNLRKTKLNDTLRLSKIEVITESPYLSKPINSARLTCWIGGDERPEFINQSTIMPQVWDDTALIIEDKKHHFDVIDGLKDPNSAMVATLLG